MRARTEPIVAGDDYEDLRITPIFNGRMRLRTARGTDAPGLPMRSGVIHTPDVTRSGEIEVRDLAPLDQSDGVPLEFSDGVPCEDFCIDLDLD